MQKPLKMQNSYKNGCIFCFSDQMSELKQAIYLNEIYVLDLNCQTLNIQMKKNYNYTKTKQDFKYYCMKLILANM